MGLQCSRWTGPWIALFHGRLPASLRAATVHLGGTLPEIAASEHAACTGQRAEAPYMILAQQSLLRCFTRAPAGQHTAWAYCHVPHGSTVDVAGGRLEAQIERFAPGFRDRVLARSIMSPAAFEQYNANYIGGDMNGGVQDCGSSLREPTVRPRPLCHTGQGTLHLLILDAPPGGGVHGMCGYWAARAALRRDLGQ